MHINAHFLFSFSIVNQTCRIRTWGIRIHKYNIVSPQNVEQMQKGIVNQIKHTSCTNMQPETINTIVNLDECAGNVNDVLW